MTYVYNTSKPYGSALWIAYANMHAGGDDAGVRKVGKGYKSEADAKAACRAHFALVTKAAANFGRPEPRAIF